jgi:hypothetical protein
MVLRVRTALVAVASVFALVASFAASANASVLSLLPGTCPGQSESQVFAQFGDSSQYTPVPGGSFEAGSAAWALTGGAAKQAGNESFNVAGGSTSLSLPAGSSATSPSLCTSIYHPTVRFFLRNTGSSSSHLKVEALYPGLLGGTNVAVLGTITASSSWAPSAPMGLLVSNLLGTLSLDSTTIGFRFVPVDSTGHWSIDDVYLDPYCRG